jgi:hypothetical protein
VVSSKAQRKKDIEALGATAAIGSVEDVHFLTSAFAGADAVYCMLPPGHFADSNFDLIAHANEVAKNYANAISQSGVKRAVHLSSIGAHTDKGNGILIFHFNAENILRKLPSDVAITFMRPVGFPFVGGVPKGGERRGGTSRTDRIPAAEFREDRAEGLDGEGVQDGAHHHGESGDHEAHGRACAGRGFLRAGNDTDLRAAGRRARFLRHDGELSVPVRERGGFGCRRGFGFQGDQPDKPSGGLRTLATAAGITDDGLAADRAARC